LQGNNSAGILKADLVDQEKRSKPFMYIAIEGVIGVGKTTLARLLQNTLDAELLLEVFEENPFLSSFYEDRKRYAFQTQIFFLLSRYHQQKEAVPGILSNGHKLIVDYTFAKDALFARINLEGDELEMYQRVHDALAEKIPLPDLIVYLRAETKVLMQRIAMRDRPYERNMESSYIESVNEAYDDFFGKFFRGVPVLTISTDDLDIIKNEGDLESVRAQIQEALISAPRQVKLPLSAK
jgi:deoxyguanosine kinase